MYIYSAHSKKNSQVKVAGYETIKRVDKFTTRYL